MDDFETQFQKEGREVHLLRSEKEAIKQRILTMPEPAPARYVTYFDSLYSGRMATAALGLLIIVGSAPLTYAAQRSVPGDFLHGFELSVVEPLEEVVQFTFHTRIAYATNRLEERLQEVQATTAAHMTPEEVATVTENVQKHVQDIFEALPQETDKKDMVDNLIKVSALVNAHEDLLSQPSPEVSDMEDLNDAVTAELLDQVQEYALDKTQSELLQAVK